MCQLTFINSNDKELNKSILINQFLVNTVTSHRDGYGFFHKETGLFKTGLHPWETSNLGELISDRIKNSEPILAHVRLATVTNNVKEISNENSHPFETKDFVVAHNGSFEGDILSEERFKDKIDSEIFTILLQETYEKNPKWSIVKLVNEAYSENLTGKFAFLIYFKPVDKFYIIRGKTATLFKSDISEYNPDKKSKKVGFIVNTEKVDLERAFIFANKNNQLKTGNYFKIEEPEALKSETIFQVNHAGIREIGSIEQKNKVTTTPTYAQTQRDSFTWNSRSYVPYNKSTANSNLKSDEDFLLELYDVYGLTIPEIDLLFLEIVGLPIIASTKEEFKIFEEIVESYLEEHTKHKGDLWKHLTERTFDPLEMYDHFGLQFPYFLNEVSTLNNRWIKERNKRMEEDKKYAQNTN